MHLSRFTLFERTTRISIEYASWPGGMSQKWLQTRYGKWLKPDGLNNTLIQILGERYCLETSISTTLVGVHVSSTHIKVSRVLASGHSSPTKGFKHSNIKAENNTMRWPSMCSKISASHPFEYAGQVVHRKVCITHTHKCPRNPAKALDPFHKAPTCWPGSPLGSSNHKM